MLSALHVSWEYPPYRIIGQLAWRVRDLVRELRGKCRVVVVHPGPEERRYEDEGVEVYMLRDTGYPRSNFLVYAHELVYEMLTRLPYTLPYTRFTAVHGHDWVAGMAALVLSRVFNRPFVLSVYSLERVRSPMDSMLSLSIDSIESYLMGAADYVLCHRCEILEDLRKTYGGKVLPCNGADDVVELYRRIKEGERG